VAAVTAGTVHFEVWIPSGDWSGDFEAVDNGGFAGTISYPAMAQALRAGYATASTDTGHSATDTANTWISDPTLLADWGHRSIHLMTAPAEQAVAVYRRALRWPMSVASAAVCGGCGLACRRPNAMVG
jgi:feruloyl esterase